MLTDIINQGMNNPDCAFFTGALFGTGMNSMFIIYILAFGLIYRITDKLAFEPFTAWLKLKLYKKGDDKHE